MDRELFWGIVAASPVLCLFGWLVFSLPFAIHADLVAWKKRRHRRRNPRPVWVDPYGEHHQLERAKYAKAIRASGGHCMERICVMPSRRIEPGAYWHLAHDHVSGGPSDYLGPAHPECNEQEARERGVIWEGMGPSHFEASTLVGQGVPLEADEFDPNQSSDDLWLETEREQAWQTNEREREEGWPY